MQNGTMEKPLLIEIKGVTNVSKPFQKVSENDWDDAELAEKRAQKVGPKKTDMYQLIAHDGVRFLKIILLFSNQGSLVKNIRETNKFYIQKGTYFNAGGENSSTFMVDTPQQIVEVYSDRKSHKLQESHVDVKGLPVKYTDAPKFVFLNEQAQDASTKQEEEHEDEFADLFRKFDCPDLSPHERTYINRFQNLGFWRKKFHNTVAKPVENEEKKV